MSTTIIGKVRSPCGKLYDVKWDQLSHDIYVSWGGWAHIGKAASATEAMIKAEAWLSNK